MPIITRTDGHSYSEYSTPGRQRPYRITATIEIISLRLSYLTGIEGGTSQYTTMPYRILTIVGCGADFDHLPGGLVADGCY